MLNLLTYYRSSLAIAAVGLCVSGAGVQAATITNFMATFDTTNNRLQFDFHLDPAGADTPVGVDVIRFDFGFIANPFSATTNVLFSSPTVTAIGLIGSLPADQVQVQFAPITVPTSVTIAFGGADASVFAEEDDFSLEATFNPSTFDPGSIFKDNQRQTIFFGPPVPFKEGTVVPVPPALPLFLGGLAGLAAWRKLSRTTKG